MSLWMDVVVLSKQAFAKLEAEPELLDAVVFDDDAAAKTALGLTEADTVGIDYLTLLEALDPDAVEDADEEEEEEAEEEEEEEEEDADDEESDGEEEEEEEEEELPLEVSGVIDDVDAGYGPAFFVQPSDASFLDEDAWLCAKNIDTDLGALLERAKREGLYVIGLIS